MYELTVMLAVFLLVAISCWWIGDGDETLLEDEHNAAPLHPTPCFRVQEHAGLGD